ncbi:MAG: phosphatase PAP2 family protein [Bacteroidales bacterium]|nr:phosphatase PAP2 family protein [Bacteroidales bacterium]
MLEILNIWDIQLFLFLNGMHNSFWDVVMFWLSNKFIWIPLYLFFIYLLAKFYKKEAIWISLVLIILIAITDQLSVHLFKNIFERLRPCHEPSLEGMVHIVYGKCGGQFGFVSSHASNHFAMAIFLSGFLGKKIRYFTPLIFLWAFIISYSRIYLGVHYPGDVAVGGLFGASVGVLINKVYFTIRKELISS